VPRILQISHPHLSPRSPLLHRLGTVEVETKFPTYDKIVILSLNEIREHTYPG
jgi:hypothetical protein